MKTIGNFIPSALLLNYNNCQPALVEPVLLHSISLQVPAERRHHNALRSRAFLSLRTVAGDPLEKSAGAR